MSKLSQITVVSICMENGKTVFKVVSIFLYIQLQVMGSTLKPIFYHNVNLLALGSRVGLESVRDDFALPITTCWYPKSLVYPTRLQPEPVEYSPRWVCKGRVRVGYVDFMLFTSCSLALGTQFPVEYGL